MKVRQQLGVLLVVAGAVLTIWWIVWSAWHLNPARPLPEVFPHAYALRWAATGVGCCTTWIVGLLLLEAGE